MKISRVIIYFFAIVQIYSAAISQNQESKLSISKNNYFGQNVPDSIPEIFAQGFISLGYHEHGIAFSPKNDEMFFVAADSKFSRFIIMHSKLVDGLWSEPKISSFSGKYFDISPSFSPDGNRLYFSSIRPTDDSGKERTDLDIWYVERTGSDWGKPKNIGEPINSKGNESNPTFMKDGTMVFQYIKELGALKWDLYISKISNGIYQKPEILPNPVNSDFNEAGPFISPDGSFLMFNSNRDNKLFKMHIYISYKKSDGGWMEPIPLNKINSKFGEFGPVISRDGKILFFSSFRNLDPVIPLSESYSEELLKLFGKPVTGRGTLYWINSKFIEELKPVQ